MGIIVKPNTFVDGNVIVASEINADFDTIYTLVNGNIDDANIKAGANIDGSKFLNASINANNKLINASISEAKIDYNSVKVLRTGPNLPTNGLKVARGSKAYTFAAGVVSVTITFMTDSDDGDPQFSATPRITFGNRHASTGNTLWWQVTAISSSSVTVEIRSSSGADVSSGNLDWIAIGASS